MTKMQACGHPLDKIRSSDEGTHYCEMCEEIGETNQKHMIKDFHITWEADHEQYWQGHGISFTKYDACFTGYGDSLNEAFNDALDQLQNYDLEQKTASSKYTIEEQMWFELRSRVKLQGDLDLSVSDVYCNEDDKIQATQEHQEECAVCTGAWHYYVNIDVITK